jgi:copper transport protein
MRTGVQCRAALTRALRLGLALAALGLVPGRAVAHIRVSSSTPAAGSTIRTPVREIRITFSQHVTPQFTRLSLVGPDGLEAPLTNLAADSVEREFTASLDQPLANGSYLVRWRTAGADGHVLNGEYGFVVAAAHDPVEVIDSTTVGAAADPVSPVLRARAQARIRDINSTPVAVLMRWSNFIALVLALGVVAFRVVIFPASQAGGLQAEYAMSMDAALRRLGILTGVLVALAAVPRFLLQSSALAGAPAVFSADVVAPLLRSRWGIGWLLQLSAGLAMAGAALLRSRLLAVVGAIALAVSPGLSGHAVAVEPLTTLSVANDAAHVLAASTWLGSLLLIVLLALPLGLHSGGNTHADLAATVNAFSPIALTAAAVILLTGSAATLMQTTHLTQLWTTAYGRALLVKLALVLAMVVLGYHNWKRVRPTLGNAGSAQKLRRSALWELAVGALILLATAVVVALPTPH